MTDTNELRTEIDDLILDQRIKQLFQAIRQYRYEAGRNKFAALVTEIQTIYGHWTNDHRKGDDRFVLLQPKLARFSYLHDVLRTYADLGETAVPEFLKDWREAQQLMYAQFGTAHG